MDGTAPLRSGIGYRRFPEATIKGDIENGVVVADRLVDLVKDLPGVEDLPARIVAGASEVLGCPP